MSRISQCFANAATKNRAVLGVFVTAGDPDEATSAALLDSLVENGADLLNWACPFLTRWQMARPFRQPVCAPLKPA